MRCHIFKLTEDCWFKKPLLFFFFFYCHYTKDLSMNTERQSDALVFLTLPSSLPLGHLKKKNHLYAYNLISVVYFLETIYKNESDLLNYHRYLKSKLNISNHGRIPRISHSSKFKRASRTTT
jgi:hypothetical protein